MPQAVERKYLLASFDAILTAAQQLGAIAVHDESSTHYYAHQDSDDTLKMIDYGYKVEIHRLSTQNGLHMMEDIIPIDDIEAGLDWFHAKGYDELEILRMQDREFSYQDGGFALYTIDNKVYSVVLGYPEASLPDIEAALGLESAETIDIPYNKFMALRGDLKTIPTI